MSKEKQIEEMAEDIGKSDFCKHLPKELCNKRSCSQCTAEIIYEAGYRKQSENLMAVVRCCDCKYCEVVIDSIIDEPKYFCTRIVGSIPIDPTDYCSRAKMKGEKQ